MMKTVRRRAVVLAAGTLLAGATLLSAGEADAAQKMRSFPHTYSNMKLPATTNSALTPLNKVVWPHMTVFTHSQSVAIMNNGGAVQVVRDLPIAPYAAIADSMKSTLKSAGSRQTIARGGCLVTFWQNREITVRGYGRIGAVSYTTSAPYCHR